MDSSSTVLQTTEIIGENGLHYPVPDMPSALYDHCQVQLGTSVYVVGGMGPGDIESGLVFRYERAQQLILW